jgi:acyl carrier protein
MLKACRKQGDAGERYLVVEDIIREFIRTDLLAGSDIEIKHDTSLLDSNLLDSTAFLNLVLFIEEKFGFSVADADLTRSNFETVDAVCAYVAGRQHSEGRRHGEVAR